jgi:hypothetical protein
LKTLRSRQTLGRGRLKGRFRRLAAKYFLEKYASTGSPNFQITGLMTVIFGTLPALKAKISSISQLISAA